MNREEAIEIFRLLRCQDTRVEVDDYKQALEMAIQALSQEPCDDATLKDIFCMGCEYREQEPCDDAISRQYLLDNCVVDKVSMPYVPINRIQEAPPVTPSKYKEHWIYVKDRLPTREEYIESNGLFIVSDGNRSYAEYFDIYDKQMFGEPTMEGFRVDKCVSKWMPLPKPCDAEMESGQNE